MGLYDFLVSCRQHLLFYLNLIFRFLMKKAFGILQIINVRDPTKRLYKLKDRQRCVVKASVVLRWKTVEIEETSVDDFLLWSDGDLCSLDVVLHPDVSLYCVTPDLAVFVRSSPGRNCYSSETSPFFYIAQYFAAREVFITSHHWFHVLSSDIAEDCRVPVTWLSSTGRCGSTMLTQIMEGVPETVCVSEPDAPFNISILANAGKITTDQKLSLLRSAIFITVFHAKIQSSRHYFKGNTQHIFIKTRSMCLDLVEDIHNICPDIIHVFMYRRHLAFLRSSRQMLSAFGLQWMQLINSDRIAARMPNIRKMLFQFTFQGSDEDKEALMDVVPTLSFTGLWTAMVSSQLKKVQQLQAKGFPMPVLLYEDILEDPVKTVGSLFDFVHLARDNLNAALKSMSKMSQSSVPGFEHSKKGDLQPTSRDKKEIETVLARLQLPHPLDDLQFTNRLGQRV